MQAGVGVTKGLQSANWQPSLEPLNPGSKGSWKSPCGPVTRRPQARVLSSAPQRPTKHSLRQLEMVTTLGFLCKVFQGPFHHLIPPHPVASLGQYSPLPHRPNQREAGVGWNLPVGFWSLTLFGVSGRHQLPYSWNMTGQGSCPAPSQLLGPQTNMANGSEPIHSSRVPLEGS